MINLDFDRDGQLIGVEVMDAREKLPPEVLKRAGDENRGDEPLRITYDDTVDAAYIYFADEILASAAAKTYPCDPLEVDGMISLDFDRVGRLIGIEVLGAKNKLPPEVVRLAQ